MTSKDIIKLTALDQYSKVMSNPYVHNNLMFLTLGGSHAYGTNTPTSDIDLRGCAFMPKEVLLGTTSQTLRSTPSTSWFLCVPLATPTRLRCWDAGQTSTFSLMTWAGNL